MSDDFKEKYINPFTDYGFKRLFGEEPSKDLLVDFLNELLSGEQGRIKKLTYLKSDRLGTSEEERKAVFDLYCENEKGEKFIVELQKTKQKFFKDRTVYYSSFPIREQAQRGSEWNFELQAVYTIAILDIRNLNKLDRIPDELRESIFEKLFEVAEIAKFTPEEARSYEDSLKTYRDLKNSIDTAREEGKIEAMTLVAKLMKTAGEPVEKIIAFTGLTHDEIENLKTNG